MLRSCLLCVCLTLGPACCLTRADEPPASLLPPGVPLEQAIDHSIDAQLSLAKMPADPPADDATLQRRLMLDLVGRVPTLHETAAYLADPDTDKKVKLVDRLMASPAFVRHGAREFLTLLLPDEAGRKGANRSAFQGYLQAAVAEDRPWDRLFREVLLPDPADARTRGSSEFLKGRVKDLNRLTIDVSSIFFGVNISCAQCHDHPQVSDWTQDHFYGMKSFFARTFEAGGFVGESESGVVKYLVNKGKEKVAPVMFLTGKTLDAGSLREPSREEQKRFKQLLDEAKKAKRPPPRPKVSLRARLVETALEPGQRDFFARAIVNRLWYRFYGRGLVMPLDQMHSANPPSHPELLQWLARDLVEHGYDLRRLVRGLVLSQAYARSSRWDGDTPPPERLFAVVRTRALTPMQLAVSLRLAAADPQAWPADPAALAKRIESLEKAAAGLARLFPEPGDGFQVGVGEAMLFANNAALQKELLQGPGALPARLLAVPELEKRADLAVRTVLGRAAQPEEVRALGDYLRQRQDRPEAACRQVVWALLTSAEFRFNH